MYLMASCGALPARAKLWKPTNAKRLNKAPITGGYTSI